MQPANLNQIISDSAKILRRDTPASINYDIRTDSSIWEINVDRLQISRAILNLGQNAIDSMKDGGTILIETKNVTLDEAYSNENLGAKPGQYALLSITDTGHGMDEKTVKHIFEPFFTTKGVGKGSAWVYQPYMESSKVMGGISNVIVKSGKEPNSICIFQPLSN